MGIFDHIVYKDGKIIDNSWVKWFHWEFLRKKAKKEKTHE